MTQTMKAVCIREYGDNAVVEHLEAPRPEPGPGEVRVAIRAAGVNPIDWKIRSGAGQRLGLTLPIRLGSEIVGVIDAVGEAVEGRAPGDRVFGIVPSGGFAEYVVVRAADLALAPEALDDIRAAALPLGALTSWQALFDIANLKAGHRLLITGGSGGVGSLAVQIARSKGAYVTAMASTRNEDFVRNLGADAFIDYTAGPFEDVVKDMDVVFDTVGGETFTRAHGVLKSGGVLVSAVAFPSEEGPRPDVRVERVYTKADAPTLDSIRRLVDAGRVEPQVSAVLPLSEVRRALEMSEDGHVRGKIVLTID